MKPPEGWKGGVGFVTKEMIKEHLPEPAFDIKVCFNLKMFLQVLKWLGYGKTGKVGLTKKIFVQRFKLVIKVI